MKKYIHPVDSMIRDAAFVAFIPPTKLHECGAKFIEEFRETQRKRYANWRYRSN